MNASVTLYGWQSWTDCRNVATNSRIRNNSPHGQDIRLVDIEERPQKIPAWGWNSWHWHGPDISETSIWEQTQWIAQHHRELPLTYIVVDDGWQKAWGDFEPDRQKFPNGLPALAQQIQSTGLTPGIWLAPFLVHPYAQVAKQYPDWLVTEGNGPMEGSKISRFDRLLPRTRWVLDLNLPEVNIYLMDNIDQLVESGFKLLKLDFLYAQHFNPRFTTSKIPDRLLRTFLATIRTRHPDVYTIACGCPLAPAVDTVDAMRISEDINVPHLKHLWPLNRIITTQRLRQLKENLAKRQGLSQLWHLDPDAFVSHSAHGLTKEETMTLHKTIKQTEGVIFLGDDLKNLLPQHLETYIYPLFQ